AGGGELRQLEKRRARIDQAAHPVARQELAALQMALASLLSAAFAHARHATAQLLDQSGHHLRVRAERLGAPFEPALDHGHARCLTTIGTCDERESPWRR